VSAELQEIVEQYMSSPAMDSTAGNETRLTRAGEGGACSRKEYRMLTADERQGITRTISLTIYGVSKKTIPDVLAVTQAHTHNRFTALLDFVRDYPGEPTPESYDQEGVDLLDLLEQEIVSGNGISWAICKSTP